MDIRPYLQAILSYIESNDYAGYDPYDALNSPLLNLLSSKSKWTKIAFTQFLKRCPLNLRPMLGVKKGHNPKGIGLFLWGYTKLYAIEKREEYLEKINYLLYLLDKLRSKGYSGNSWGYNFDLQSRASFVPKYTPTIVNSSFIGHALLDTYRATGNQKALDLAMPVSDFILNDLKRHSEGQTCCFSYTPLDENYVHNANLLGASLLIRLSKISGDNQHEDAALSSLAYSMKYQHSDGSWYYAETDYQKWIDSFHTGFNLQAIRYFIQEGFIEYEAAFEKGIRFYADNFFLEDGTPKYYHDHIHPIDVHASAQAIVFFSALAPRYSSLITRLTEWMIQNLYDPKGYFYFRKTKYGINKIPYMRWSQAWAFHALTSFAIILPQNWAHD